MLVGYADNNIANNTVAAFDRSDIVGEPTYAMLWHRKSDTQTQMVVQPDQMGTVREGKDQLAAAITQRMSGCHISRDTQYSAQRLLMAWTEEETIGGAGWPNLKAQLEHEKALMVWGNSTLGIAQYWYRASRQQGARGRMSVRSIAQLPFLDPTRLDSTQLTDICAIFDDMMTVDFLPIYLLDEDDSRKELDRRLLEEVFGCTPSTVKALDLFRKKLCSEPSMHGGKKK